MAFAGVFVATACEEDFSGHIYDDDSAPAAVTDVVATPKPGGADITYSLPDDRNLLYVEAELTLPTGKVINAKSSSYNNVIEIRGLASTEPRQVTLYSVSKGGSRSSAVSVTINPLTPPYMDVYDTIKMREDFGGINVTFENETNASLAVVLSYLDENSNEYVEYDAYYTEESSVNHSFRGLENETRKFSVYVRDRFDNMSPMVEADLTPLYEELIDKSKFKAVTGIKGDGNGDGTYPTDGQSQPAYMWDGIYATVPDTYANWRFFYVRAYDRQCSFTFDLGQEIKLSRMRFNHYYAWSYMCAKEFEVYGCSDITQDMYDGSYDKWTLLASCKFDKPSGLPSGSYGAGDAEAFAQGSSFNVDIEAPRVRYIRVKALECWDGGGSVSFSEITAWGDARQ